MNRESFSGNENHQNNDDNEIICKMITHEMNKAEMKAKKKHDTR